MSDVLQDTDAWWANEGPDAPEEWNFSSVPDSEVLACCVWEYARESKTIALRADLHWCHVRDIWHREEYKDNPFLKAEHDAEARRILARAKREKFRYGAFFDQLWKTDFPMIEIYDSIVELVRNGAFPWQRLPITARANLAKRPAENNLLPPLETAKVGNLRKYGGRIPWNSTQRANERRRPTTIARMQFCGIKLF
jgi:hypothetical protein